MLFPNNQGVKHDETRDKDQPKKDISIHRFSRKMHTKVMVNRTKIQAQCWTTGTQKPQVKVNRAIDCHAERTVETSGGTQRETGP